MIPPTARSCRLWRASAAAAWHEHSRWPMALPPRASRMRTKAHCASCATPTSYRARISRATWSSPASVAHLDEAVRWISEAGGVAVLAHPGRYRVGELKLHELVHEFREAGGVAIEVVTSNHSPEQTRQFARVALEMDLEASRGSDFHGPGEAENVELGAVAPLPAGLTPVWHRFS